MITERFTRNCNKVEVLKWVIARMQPNGIRDRVGYTRDFDCASKIEMQRIGERSAGDKVEIVRDLRIP